MTTPDFDSSTSNAPPQRLFTFSSGGWVILLSVILMLITAGLVLYPVYVNGLHPPIGDGQHVESYGFDLTNLTVPREQLVASGNPKDGIDAIPPGLVETITPAEVDLIVKNEHIRFLVPADRVIGVLINSEARAYPVRVLALHELVNDTIQGVPIAVSWSPLCDSALVFDRRIDGAAPSATPPVEFGVSGLLVDSNPVFFDRRKEAKQESLWPQLALHAISGPSAEKPFSLIPYELVTWQEWTKAHPATRVLLGLRRRKREYGSDPYNVYLHHDDVKFPVDPLWSDPKIRRKTPLVVTSTDSGKSWIAAPSEPASPPASPTTASASPYRIYTFLFAWYAQHPKDTDYSAIK